MSIISNNMITMEAKAWHVGRVFDNMDTRDINKDSLLKKKVTISDSVYIYVYEDSTDNVFLDHMEMIKKNAASYGIQLEGVFVFLTDLRYLCKEFNDRVRKRLEREKEKEEESRKEREEEEKSKIFKNLYAESYLVVEAYSHLNDENARMFIIDCGTFKVYIYAETSEEEIKNYTVTINKQALSKHINLRFTEKYLLFLKKTCMAYNKEHKRKTIKNMSAREWLHLETFTDDKSKNFTIIYSLLSFVIYNHTTKEMIKKQASILNNYALTFSVSLDGTEDYLLQLRKECIEYGESKQKETIVPAREWLRNQWYLKDTKDHSLQVTVSVGAVSIYHITSFSNASDLTSIETKLINNAALSEVILEGTLPFLYALRTLCYDLDSKNTNESNNENKRDNK